MNLKSGPYTKYYQLSEILRKQIVNGQLRPNAQLPTEQTLSDEYGVSRGTVRKAIDVLEQDGLIRREQGRGMFANPPRQSLNAFVLADVDTMAQRQNRQPTTQTLQAETIPAPDPAADRLDIPPGTDVHHIRQLRLIDGVPTIYEERYLKRSLCPELLTNDLEQTSIHWLLIHRYRLPLLRVTHTIERHPLQPPEADLLDVEPGETAFFVDRLTDTIDREDRECPGVWYRAIYRGDDYHFKAQFLASV